MPAQCPRLLLTCSFTTKQVNAMKRRRFIQNTLAAGTTLALPVKATRHLPPQKGFKVGALANRHAEKILYGQTPIDFKLLSSDTDDRLSVFISANNQKGFGPPLHVHHSFDEFFCVLDGDFLFQLDEETLSVKRGDTVFIPRHVRHRFDCVSEKPGTLLVSILPGKGMETFFAKMGKLLPATGAPDRAAMQKLYAAYDSEILGPPMGVK